MRKDRGPGPLPGLLLLAAALLTLLLVLSQGGPELLGPVLPSPTPSHTAVTNAPAPSPTPEPSPEPAPEPTPEPTPVIRSLEEVPEYAGLLLLEVNGGVPFFTDEDRALEPFEFYSPLDELGRCGPAFACVGKELMPTEERGPIGMIRPSGWHTVRYDDLIEDHYLYNRCHLIAYQLTAENDNPQNLITGTRHFNVSGMLPFENLTASYIRRTGNHALYRVTPLFLGGELVARGVLIEAESLEDGGDGLRFCVFVYNVQPGIVIDYATGDSWRETP